LKTVLTTVLLVLKLNEDNMSIEYTLTKGLMLLVN